MKRIAWFIPLLIPALATAQTPKVAAPNEHASDVARAKVAAAMARRATHVRGEAVGLDNRPVTPAHQASAASHATPHPGEGPAPSHRPDHAGLGGQGRGNNPRRP